jgi:spermidine synthase
MTKWMDETLYPSVKTSYACTKVLFEEKNDIQHVVLFENPTYGRMLMLDGVTQVTTADEFVYHEMMVHVPLFSLDAPKKVLIIGGGDGGIAREVLRHASVEKAVMVEIDQSVVTFSKQYQPEISNGAFENPRLELIIADGAKYVAETTEKFDAIIVDSTDPIGPGAVLFTHEFYSDCKRILNEGGVLVTQNGVPFMQSDELKQSVTFFNQIFNEGRCYVATIPTYAFGQMAMGWATDNAELHMLSVNILAERFKKAGLTTKYYTPAVHAAAFALPAYIDMVVEEGKKAT